MHLLWNIHSDTTGIDSTEIQSMLALSEIQSIPGKIALNFLINEGVVTYSEKVYIPGLQKDYEEIIHQSPYYNEYSYMSIFPKVLMLFPEKWKALLLQE